MDTAITTPEPAAPLSTALETNIATSPSGGGIPKTLTEAVPDTKAPAKTESVRDSLEAEAKNLTERDRRAEKAEKVDTAKDGKEADVKADAKAEKPDAKAAEKTEKPIQAKEPAKDPTADKGDGEDKPDAAAQEKDQTERKSENRDRPEPPARFLPKAKEVWKATPAAVQSEVARMAQEHEAEVSQYRESHTFRQELKEFEDLGRASNTTVKQALTNYVNIEKQFHAAPHEGFKALLSNLKMQPAAAIGAILQAYNVSPQALAAHLQQSPETYSPLQPRQQQQQLQPQQQQPNPEIEGLKKELQDIKLQTVTNNVIAPFAAQPEHSRYYELETDIAFFLNSGKIPTSLSPVERLSAAYDMAERINPSSRVEPTQDEDNSSRVDAQDFNGTKSVKSSPGNVLEIEPSERKMSIRELLQDEIKRSKRA